VRLYTNIQQNGTDPDTPIEAFAAAVKTNTTLLLGIWCSGTDSIDNELSALTKAIKQHGKEFTDLVVGISVGSEDLYRVSEIGIRNKSGVGADAKAMIAFIKQTRNKLKGTALAKTPVGHVDTWTTWVNTSNKAVVDEVDFVGVDIYPYYEDDKDNDISNATTLFYNALNRTEKAAGDKPVWITETGWPSTGPKWGDAEPSAENAKKFWDDVGCKLFGRTNTWWYTQRDSNPDNKMKFGVDPDLDTTTTFDLTCPQNAGAPKTENENENGVDKTENTGNTENKPSAGAAIEVSRMNAAAVTLSLLFTFVAWLA
jgi:glucan endo-1,3-beta-D-glucosidase